MTFVILLWLTAAAVWNGTDRRPGTTDELRTLAAVFAMIVIYAGAAWLGALESL